MRTAAPSTDGRHTGRSASAEQIAATVALLAPAWQNLAQRHQRQAGYRALVGGLLRNGQAVASVEALVAALARTTEDDEADKRLALVADTAARLRAGEKVTGWPSLADLLGLDGAALVERVQQALGQNGRRIVATYDYCDEADYLRYQVVRYEPKGFSQRRPDGKGGWVSGLAGAARLLYRLPALLNAGPSQTVFVCEGEKDVEALRALGLVATCNPEGAGKWRPEFNEALRGRPVVVLPDRDEPGAAHARDVARHLTGVAASVKVLELPDLPEAGGDVSDWLDAGGTRSVLERLASACPVWQERACPAAAPGSGSRRVAVRPLPPFVSFPLGTLPPGLSDYVAASAEAIGCDPALVVCPVLATVAGCIGNSRAVLLKKGWIEPAVVWSLTVAVSGGHKSPAWDKATRPLFDEQMDLYEEYRAQVDAHKKELEAWQDEADKKKRGDKPKAPEEPLVFIATDPTIEALAEMLEDNPRGLMLARDELDAWFQSFTRYQGKHGGSNRAQWLELHRAGTLLVNRRTGDRKRMAVRRASVSITGTIQPSVLRAALDTDALQAGLGARFLLAMPPRRRRIWTEAEVADELATRYRGLIAALLALDLGDTQKHTPHVLGLSGPAKRLWVDFYNEWGHAQYTAEGEQEAAFAKIEAYASRLMLLHHVVAHADVEADDRRSIGAASARAGIEQARWFAAEACRIYGMLCDTEEEHDARRLVEWITARGGRVTARQLQRSNSRRWPSSDLAESSLQALGDGGLGHWEDVPSADTGRPPLRRFVLHDLPSDKTDKTPDDNPPFPEGPSDKTPDDNPPNDRNSQSCEVLSVLSDGKPKQGTAWEAREPGQAVGVLSDASAGRPSPGSAAAPLSNGQAIHSSDPLSIEPQRSATAYRTVTDAAGLELVATALDEAYAVALDLETTGLNPRSDRMRLLSLAAPTLSGEPFAYVIDVDAIDPAPLFALLAGRTLIGHHLTFDLQFLARRGFEPGKVCDTLLYSQLVHGTRQPKGFHTLAQVAERELGQPLSKELQTSDWSGPLTAEQLDYAARDVLVLLPLLDALKKQIAQTDQERVAAIESRCLPAVAWLASSGVCFDRPAWEALAAEATAVTANLAARLDEAAPPRPDALPGTSAWNWDSAKQVQQVFALAGVSLDSTGDDALAAVAHPLAELLREHRSASKRVSTYGPGWAAGACRDGRLHVGWRQIGADSGRMSCSGPNLQNLPRDARYRACLTAPPGRVLVKADYSQVELRIAAAVSGDAALMDAYRRGDDLHTLTARRVLGKEDVGKPDRQIAKSLNFGLLYGMGADSLRVYARSTYGVDLTEDEARQYRDSFFTAYPGLATWHRRIRSRQTTETRTLAGRRRLLDATTPDTQRLNTPIQGTGADGLKTALALLWERRHDCPGAFPVLAVHDEVVVECDQAQADKAAVWLRQAMLDGMAPLIDPVPVEVDVKVSRTWGGD